MTDLPVTMVTVTVGAGMDARPTTAESTAESDDPTPATSNSKQWTRLVLWALGLGCAIFFSEATAIRNGTLNLIAPSVSVIALWFAALSRQPRQWQLTNIIAAAIVAAVATAAFSDNPRLTPYVVAYLLATGLLFPFFKARVGAWIASSSDANLGSQTKMVLTALAAATLTAALAASIKTIGAVVIEHQAPFSDYVIRAGRDAVAIAMATVVVGQLQQMRKSAGSNAAFLRQLREDLISQTRGGSSRP